MCALRALTPQKVEQCWISPDTGSGSRRCHFGIAYLVVILEERLHLRKSIPVLVGAGAHLDPHRPVLCAGIGDTTSRPIAFRHNLLDFAELFLFLIVAMTYVNTMEERGVFNALRVWLVGPRPLPARPLLGDGRAGLRHLAGRGQPHHRPGDGRRRHRHGGENSRSSSPLACINIVVAANAGGAFSPFGDITTLMVWQEGMVPFTGFFALFLPVADQLARARGAHGDRRLKWHADCRGEEARSGDRGADRRGALHRHDRDDGPAAQLRCICHPWLA